MTTTIAQIESDYIADIAECADLHQDQVEVNSITETSLDTYLVRSTIHFHEYDETNAEYLKYKLENKTALPRLTARFGADISSVPTLAKRSYGQHDDKTR